MFGLRSTPQASDPFTSDRVAASCWFDGAADYLHYTPAAGNRDTYTISFWTQRWRMGAEQRILSTGTGGAAAFYLYFNASDKLVLYDLRAGANATVFETTRVFRDVAWFHIVLKVDRTQATAADRITLFVNGDEITAFDASTDPNQNEDSYLNAAVQHFVGYAITYYPISLAQFTFIDGTALDATDFGEVISIGANGRVWAAKSDADVVALADTAGGNSYCLTSAIGSGTDASANANNLTAVSMSHAANGRANSPSNPIAIVNAGDPQTTWTISKGGTYIAGSASISGSCRLNMPAVGAAKYYAELKITSFNIATPEAIVGVETVPDGLIGSLVGFTPTSYGLYTNNGNKYNDSVANTYGSGFALNDIVQVAWDGVNGDIYFGKNNQWSNGAGAFNQAWSGAVAAYTGIADPNPVLKISDAGSTTTVSFEVRTDSADWSYSAPAGYNQISVANFPAPTNHGADWFKALTYAGNGVAIGSGGQAVTGAGFQPDMAWLKDRDAARSWNLFDVLRGTTKYIQMDAGSVEATAAETLDSFDADGFTVGNDAEVNTSAEDYMAYLFRAGGAGVANSDGTISSTVSVASADHMSIVEFTGTGANGTVGHGLGDAPEMVIVFNLDTSSAVMAYHAGIASDAETDYVQLSASGAAVDDATAWNDTAPTATVFSVGSAAAVNGSTDRMLAICFRSVAGVCKVGSYTGNGSTSGPLVMLDFAPAFLLSRRTDVGNSGVVEDTTMNSENVAGSYLVTDTNAAELVTANANLDFLSLGFKLRTSAATLNASGGNYAFLALADVGMGTDLPPIPGR